MLHPECIVWGWGGGMLIKSFSNLLKTDNPDQVLILSQYPIYLGFQATKLENDRLSEYLSLQCQQSETVIEM